MDSFADGFAVLSAVGAGLGAIDGNKVLIPDELSVGLRLCALDGSAEIMLVGLTVGDLLNSPDNDSVGTLLVTVADADGIVVGLVETISFDGFADMVALERDCVASVETRTDGEDDGTPPVTVSFLGERKTSVDPGVYSGLGLKGKSKLNS